MQYKINPIQNAFKGIAMGIAEVIPGVSGGTIAFITGIYEQLLNSIKAIGPELFNSFKKNGFKGAWETVNGPFLVSLLIGMVGGVVFGVFVISHLLENYPLLLWGFFFGLIIASAIYIGRQIDGWSWKEVLLVIAGTAIAYYITIATPSTGNEALWFVFISGAIAISALILPGISGSFILLIMGMYTIVVETVRTAITTFDTKSLLTVFTFACGCLVGLFTFSRILSWTFKHHRNMTLAILTGFMIGSLNKIWPWRNVLSTRTNSKGVEVPFLESSVLPSSYQGDPQVIWVILLIVIGFVSVFAIEKIGSSKEK